MSIKAVIFDLDDTLFHEIDYVKSGFESVAIEAKEKFGIENAEEKFLRLFRENKSGVFDRFAGENGLSKDAILRFIEIYRNHMPNIFLPDGTKITLETLRRKGYKLGIITDGRPRGQRNKINALGLKNFVDKIIITDELGGTEFRKPHPEAFEIMCKEFGINPEEAVYVGDNPQKDFAIKKFLPITTVRMLFKDGMYNETEFLYGIPSDITIGSLNELCSMLAGDNN